MNEITQNRLKKTVLSTHRQPEYTCRAFILRRRENSSFKPKEPEEENITELVALRCK
jgi:hypothetical protein